MEKQRMNDSGLSEFLQSRIEALEQEVSKLRDENYILKSQLNVISNIF